MNFEVITYCPIDLNEINYEMLNLDEKSWLNEYHQLVFEKLLPELNDEEKDWLKEETRAI